MIPHKHLTSRHIFSLLLGLFILSACNYHRVSDYKVPKNVDDNNEDVKSERIVTCFGRKMKILISNSFRDTTLLFRNSSLQDTTLLIICDTNQVSYIIERLILKSKYLPYTQLKGYYSFLTCTRTYGDTMEIGLFMVNKSRLEAVEMRKFRISDNRINGLILLPGTVNEFMTTEEYDKIEASTEDL